MNKGGVAAWADVPKGTLGNLTPADRHGSVQVRAGAPPVYHPPLLLKKCYPIQQTKNENINNQFHCFSPLVSFYIAKKSKPHPFITRLKESFDTIIITHNHSLPCLIIITFTLINFG